MYRKVLFLASLMFASTAHAQTPDRALENYAPAGYLTLRGNQAGEERGAANGQVDLTRTDDEYAGHGHDDHGRLRFDDVHEIADAHERRVAQQQPEGPDQDEHNQDQEKRALP